MQADSGELEVGRRGLAALHGNLVADLLAFIQAAKPSRLHCGDVDKPSLPPSCGMMKPKPLVVLNHLTVPVAIICVTLRQTHREKARCW